MKNRRFDKTKFKEVLAGAAFFSGVAFICFNCANAMYEYSDDLKKDVAIAKNPRTSPKKLAEIADASAFDETYRAVARNPNTPTWVLKRMVYGERHSAEVKSIAAAELRKRGEE